MTSSHVVAIFQQPTDVVIAALNSDMSHGLTTVEAHRRHRQYGANELDAEPPIPAWRTFLAQFQNVLVIVLLIAAAISLVVWLYEREQALPYEAIVIVAIVLLNGILGFIQEARAARAVAALRALAAAEASVIRNGETVRIAATELVPGDILLIEEGATIPADGRVIQSIALHTLEASLTGESLPVSKDTDPLTTAASLGDRSNMLFSGTTASYGRGRMVVTATGMQTEMGKIAGLLRQTTSERTPLQRELDRTGKWLGIVVIGMAVIMIGTILLLEEVRDVKTIVAVLILGVALAVAAVPEGLPTIVTAVLALGVQRMARRKAIIRKLPAVETLGSASIIASDKTGTLTRNEMTVRTIVTASGRVEIVGIGYGPSGELRQTDDASSTEAMRSEVTATLSAANRANNAVVLERDGRWTILGDPTEGALIVAAQKAGLTEETLTARFPRVGEVPFSSERKLMSTVHTDSTHPERLLVFTKGAPDVLLNQCTAEWVEHAPRRLSEERRATLRTLNEQLAGEGLRIIGIASRVLPRDALDQAHALNDELEHDLVLLGFVGMIDPPRDEAKAAITRAKMAGIRSIMITGDHPKTAMAIAMELGIAGTTAAVTGAEVESLSEEALRTLVQECSVYARVNPEHKLRLVKALQQNGAVVAMTGDGVNDAPALKAADIGVAMGITGTDVSKEAADMILADDNFATIVAAVEEGRAIFVNIQKFLFFLLSSNIGEVLTMFGGVVLASVLGLSAGNDAIIVPLLATQILWINLVTDGTPALALGLEPANAAVMHQPPRPHGSSVIPRGMWIRILVVGVIMAVGTLLVLDAALPGGLIHGSQTMEYGRTMAFTTLMLFQMYNVFNARSYTQSAFSHPFQNPWLWGAVTMSLVLHMMVITVPVLQRAFSTVSLTARDWLTCLLVASIVLWVRELDKVGQRHRLRGTQGEHRGTTTNTETDHSG
ncbi:ATPase, P-type (transporting), HAD superfamily, subfamily IC (plasmid) [Herpetosiphon aurantiacus DSM 785]|uniref:ATPase, P-type (Transporting), HAD superfamily, subfamily IC n=1 Tax=Herpetosiphon aurantiacus (strain ATCC 23779 / DSM 785 / 114-95) TaxID=316274 RepID=A9B901_HERA2|nr:ATPase, P-type (transporting), HAD superfamily, subfamily IC [Herpetosiphon aurantiacus DSM 785]